MPKPEDLKGPIPSTRLPPMHTSMSTLIMISHNVRGLGSHRTHHSFSYLVQKTMDLDRLWTSLKASIVLLQESLLDSNVLSSSFPNWHCLAACPHAQRHGFAQSSRRSSGVAILIRKTCLSQYGGPVTLHPAPISSRDGRLLTVLIDWNGHSLAVSSIHLPNAQADQKLFLQHRLLPLYSDAGTSGRQPIWGGDFNFTMNPPLDRRRGTSAAPPNHPDSRLARLWSDSLPDMVDSYRLRHPYRRRFSHHHYDGASRIDRFYVHQPLHNFVTKAEIGPGGFAQSGAHLSDHQPIILHLAPRSSPPSPLPRAAGGNPPSRIPTKFLVDQDLKKAFGDHLLELVDTAPTSSDELIDWWPGFKKQVSARAQALHRQFCGRINASKSTVQVNYAQGESPPLTTAPRMLDEDRPAWLLLDEQPGPVLTSRIHSRPPAGPIALKTGHNISVNQRACADTLINHYAQVSADRPPDPNAFSTVLASIPPAQAQDHPPLKILPSDVLMALKGMRPSQPGIDGMKIALYRQCHVDVIAALLARLFNACLEHHRLPCRFSMGLIVPIYKKGDVTAVENYRPITLLNLDYRIFAKVISLALSPSLPRVIAPCQTAFIRGRNIGENITILVSVPHILDRLNRTGILIFCDFQKAYDTIHRPFLFAAMERCGAPPDIINASMLLLTSTWARVRLPNCVSSAKEFYAGVRQGCPLSPMLYLFVGQALVYWLQSQDIGISLPGPPSIPPLSEDIAPTLPPILRTSNILATLPCPRVPRPIRLTAIQYADDTKVFLDSRAQVGPFISAMETFEAASNQALHPSKTVGMAIGAPCDYPSRIQDIRMVASTPALGLVFHHHNLPPSVDWDNRLLHLSTRLAKLAGLGLSAFGRGVASAAYAASSLLYAAEFVPIPTATLHKAQRWIQKLVDNDLPPSSSRRRFNGIKGQLIQGRIRNGGFGALPLQFHLQARHAKWGLRLLSEGACSLWSQIGWLALELSLLNTPQPIPLLLTHHSFHAGPFPTPNPAPSFSFLPPTLQQFLDSTYRLPPLSLFSDTQPPVCLRLNWLPVSTLVAWRLCRHPQYIPVVCRAVGPSSSLPFLGWPSRNNSKHRRLQSYSVRTGTAMLSSPLIEDRLTAVSRFWSEMQLTTSVLASRQLLANSIHHLFRSCARIPVPNHYKCLVWKCIYNGLPTAARLHKNQPCGCGTGVTSPNRHHHFYQCPLAQSILRTVAHQVPQCQWSPQDTHLAIWSLSPPAQVDGRVWTLISICAIAAMELCRRNIYQRTYIDECQATPTMIASLCENAEETFWRILEESCRAAGHRLRIRSLSPSHPFIRYVAELDRWVPIRTE